MLNGRDTPQNRASVARMSEATSGFHNPFTARIALRSCGLPTSLKSHARNGEFVEPNQGDSTRPVLSQKINPFALPPTQIHIYRHPVPQEGRFAIVTDVENGMRWTRMRLRTNGADADGEVVWS
jgi:hypothetical protein